MNDIGLRELVGEMREFYEAEADISDRVVYGWIKRFESILDAAGTSAPSAGDGFVVVPAYRGYAKLGIGAYLLNHSKAGEPAELIISIATDSEKAGRTVGDERDNPEGTLIDPEKMAVRLEFVSVAGLDALEQQLRHLRSVHFAAPAAQVADIRDRAEREQANWQSAVLDALADTCQDFPIGTPPKAIIDAVIAWHVKVALDPAVSSEAAALLAAAPAVVVDEAMVKCDAWSCSGGKVVGPFDTPMICGKCDGTGFIPAPHDPVDAFLAEVGAELKRARAKFPGDRIMTIALAEEFGELCKAVLDEPSANVRKEAVQTACMAARVCIDGDSLVNEWRRAKGLDPLAAALNQGKANG